MTRKPGMAASPLEAYLAGLESKSRRHYVSVSKLPAGDACAALRIALWRAPQTAETAKHLIALAKIQRFLFTHQWPREDSHEP